MTEENFSFIVSTLKSNYSTAHGVIGHFKAKDKKVPLTLCVSTLRNKGRLVPDSFCLWQGDKIRGKGKLKSETLFKKMDAFDPCRMEITNAQDMEFGPGEFFCLKDPEQCPYDCPAKNKQKENAKEVDEHTSTLVNYVWKVHFKK